MPKELPGSRTPFLLSLVIIFGFVRSVSAQTSEPCWCQLQWEHGFTNPLIINWDTSSHQLLYGVNNSTACLPSGGNYTFSNSQTIDGVAFPFPQTLGEGSHTETNVCNVYSNGTFFDTYSESYPFINDETPPALVVTTPTPNAIEPPGPILVAGTLSDKFNDLNILYVAGNIVENEAQGVHLSSAPAFSIQLDPVFLINNGTPLGPGVIQIQIPVSAQDFAGNFSSVTIPVVVDQLPPQIAITTPAIVPNTMPNLTSLAQIAGTASDGVGLSPTLSLWIFDDTNGSSWNGSTFTFASSSPITIPLTFPSSTSTAFGIWTSSGFDDGALISGHLYSIDAQATNVVGIPSVIATSTFTFGQTAEDPGEEKIPSGCVTLTAIPPTPPTGTPPPPSASLTTTYGGCFSVCPKIDQSKCSLQQKQIGFDSSNFSIEIPAAPGQCPAGTYPSCPSGWTVPARPSQSVCLSAANITATFGADDVATLPVSIQVPDQEQAQLSPPTDRTDCAQIKGSPNCVYNAYNLIFSQGGVVVDVSSATFGEDVYFDRPIPGSNLPRCGVPPDKFHLAGAAPTPVPEDDNGYSGVSNQSRVPCGSWATQTLFVGACKFSAVTLKDQLVTRTHVQTDRTDIGAPIKRQ